MSLALPWPYVQGQYQPDSFEDRVQQNFDALARSIGVSARLRVLFGAIDSDGTILDGSGGYSVNHSATGTYVITYDNPFAGVPATLATAHAQGADIKAQDEASVTVETFVTSTGALSDRAFNFVAML